MTATTTTINHQDDNMVLVSDNDGSLAEEIASDTGSLSGTEEGSFNEEPGNETYDDCGNGGEDEDSLAAIASEDEDDYSEFVDASGRSRCVEPVLGYYHDGDARSVATSSVTKMSPQITYGPNGLAFDINQPWERSLLRHLQEGCDVIPPGEPLNQSLNHGSEVLLLGHTESRDFAVEVNNDNISLCTSASSTVPTKMQIIHRTFLNSMMQSNSRVETKPNTEEQQRQGHLERSPCRIGDVVKGCRSADESTVSYLTSYFGGPQDDRDELQGGMNNSNNKHDKSSRKSKERSHHSRSRNYNAQSNNHRQNQQQLPISSNRDYHNQQQIPYSSNRSSSGKKHSALPYGYQRETNVFDSQQRFLEIEPSDKEIIDHSTTDPQANHNLLPDASCMCLGYNVFDYVLPTPPMETLCRSRSGRNAVRRLSQQASQLTRVDEEFPHDMMPQQGVGYSIPKGYYNNQTATTAPSSGRSYRFGIDM